MDYNDYSSYGNSNSGIFNLLGGSNAIAISVAVIVCAILAVIGGIVLHFTFLSKKNEYKFNGILGWLYNFLSFKKLLAETMLKIVYLISAIYITLFSFAALFTASNNLGINFLTFLLTLVIGNIVLRLVYEFLLLLILICSNTSEISKKLGADKFNNSPLQSQQPPVEEYYQPPVEEYYQPQQVQTQSVVFCRGCGQQYDSVNQACPYCGQVRQ